MFSHLFYRRLVIYPLLNMSVLIYCTYLNHLTYWIRRCFMFRVLAALYKDNSFELESGGLSVIKGFS